MSTMKCLLYPFESQKVAFLQPPAAHARALSNRYARNTLAAILLV